MLMVTAKHCDHFYSINSPLKGSSLEISHHIKASIQLPSQDHTRLNPPRDEVLHSGGYVNVVMDSSDLSDSIYSI